MIVGMVITIFSFNVEHLASGKQVKTAVIDIDFDHMRQIMVHKNGTKSIIEYSGMKLIDQRTLDLKIDTSADKRPLLNALRGKSKAVVSAVKILTVQPNDPSMETDVLELRQVAEIDPRKIAVVTSSTAAAGKLDQYTTTLFAKRNGQFTEFTVTVLMTIRTKVPWMFKSRVDEEVQQAADQAVDNQLKAMTQLFQDYSDQQLIVFDASRE